MYCATASPWRSEHAGMLRSLALLCYTLPRAIIDVACSVASRGLIHEVADSLQQLIPSLCRSGSSKLLGVLADVADDVLREVRAMLEKRVSPDVIRGAQRLDIELNLAVLFEVLNLRYDTGISANAMFVLGLGDEKARIQSIEVRRMFPYGAGNSIDVPPDTGLSTACTLLKIDGSKLEIDRVSITVKARVRDDAGFTLSAVGATAVLLPPMSASVYATLIGNDAIRWYDVDCERREPIEHRIEFRLGWVPFRCAAGLETRS